MTYKGVELMNKKRDLASELIGIPKDQYYQWKKSARNSQDVVHLIKDLILESQLCKKMTVFVYSDREK